MTAGAMSVPGGNPVTEVPGLSPRFPPAMVVGPVLVTVEPARTLKFPAVPNGTGDGGAHVAEVVKVHTKLAASGRPDVSCAPVVIVAVNLVLGARLVEGVKVAILVAAA